MIELTKYIIHSATEGFWQFCAILILVGGIVGGVLNFFLFCWRRLLRTINILKHGWPPEHCDGDGDFKPEPKKEEES